MNVGLEFVTVSGFTKLYNEDYSCVEFEINIKSVQTPSSVVSVKLLYKMSTDVYCTDLDEISRSLPFGNG